MPATRAIVISREIFGESDLYVQFLTRDWGMVTLLAKAGRKSKRRYIGGLDLFCHNEISVKNHQKERAYLNELTVLNSFQGLRDDLDRLEVAGRALHWVKKLVNVSTPVPQVYSLLGQTLALIEKENDRRRLEILLFVFKLKLIEALGIKPEVDNCARCHSEIQGAVNFDFPSGGAICRACLPVSREEDRLLDAEDRAILKQGFTVRLVDWPHVVFNDNRSLQLTRLITHFTSFHTHVRLPH